MKRRRLVAIESPFKGTVCREAFPDEYDRQVERNKAFVLRVMHFASFQRGLSPFAMHALYPQFMDDTIPAERLAGLECGLSWTDHADLKWFCLRPEDTISSGMWLAIDALKGREAYLMRFTQEGELLSETRLTPETIEELRATQYQTETGVPLGGTA